MDKLEEAYNKVRKKEEKNDKIRSCILADICPKCAGENLEQYKDERGFKFGDKYKCPDCGAVIDMP